MNPTDVLLSTAQKALHTLFAPPVAQRACPTAAPGAGPAIALTPEEQAHAAGLMRVNHVGEICAQALYTSQSIATKNEAIRAHFMQAAQEEGDHLAWTQARLQALGARASVLNPLWYGGAFVLGFAAGKLGDAFSLGFVEETERQVQAHLEGHLYGNLPENDHASRAIVAQMREDEMAHGAQARALGAEGVPQAVKSLMRLAARVMTGVAYRV